MKEINNVDLNNMLKNLKRQASKQLNEADYQPPFQGAIQKSHEITKQLDVRHKNLHIAFKFNEMEVSIIEYLIKNDLKRNRENESLLEKIKHLQTKSLTQLSKTQYSSKSLISGCKRKEENRIILENFNMAKRMINLPPVISNKKLDQDYTQHINDLNLIRKYHTFKPLNQNISKTSVLYAQLQNLTLNQFSRTKSGANFGFIEKQITAQNYLCLIDIISTNLSAKLLQKNQNNNDQFYWVVKSDSKNLFKSSPQEFESARKLLLDFVAPVNDNLEIVLYKVKNNDEIYVGQVELPIKFFMDVENNINESSLKCVKQSHHIYKPINIVIDCDQAPVGNIQFKVITVTDHNSSITSQIAEPVNNQDNLIEIDLKESNTPSQILNE